MATAVRPQNPSAPLIPPTTEAEQLASVGRRNFGKITSVMGMPNLIKVQIDSFNWFKNQGLQELFEEISPITDFTGKNMELRFLDYHFGEPRYSV
jgi:DNA-directed RNA polymerase subunit beta